MRTRILLGVVGLGGLTIALGQFDVGASPDGVIGPRLDDGTATARGTGLIGPDVIIWNLYGFLNWGPDGDYRAYAVGTESCNIGDASAIWISGTNQHPVIAQNMFRYKDGRFEQIGQAWLKHGFCAVDGQQCGTCIGGEGCNWLSVGCSDPYSAGLNGNQSNAGPKYEVNAYTGFFPYPPANPPWSGAIARRLRVHVSDVQAAENPGATYFVSSQYVTPDDAAAGNHFNNESYRQISLNADGAITGYPASTVRQKPPLAAWATLDPSVTYKEYRVLGEGLFAVADRVFDNGDGTWDYEYAVYNVNSDRCAGAFVVPIPPGVACTDIAFHDVDYHSGEVFDGTDWPGVVEAGAMRWATTPHDVDPDANAIRWGTLYNFRFTANAPPMGTPMVGRIELFAPGVPTEVNVLVTVPTEGFCPEDLTGDGGVNVFDLLLLLEHFGTPGPTGDITGPNPGDPPDGAVDVFDLLALLAVYGEACPTP